MTKPQVKPYGTRVKVLMAEKSRLLSKAQAFSDMDLEETARSFRIADHHDTGFVRRLEGRAVRRKRYGDDVGVAAPGCRNWPVSASQSRTVWSLPALARV
jgi:hypothetical protein